MSCITQAFIQGYVHGAQKILKAEMELYFAVSPQEWELLKPNKCQRTVDIMDELKYFLRSEVHCGNCTSWMIKAIGKKHA